MCVGVEESACKVKTDQCCKNKINATSRLTVLRKVWVELVVLGKNAEFRGEYPLIETAL